jgi:hypothetical protein
MNAFQIKSMKLRTSSRILAVLLAFVMVSCDFGDINVDPNSPSVVKTNLLITNTLLSVSDVVGGSALTGNILTQQIAETQYNDAARYSTTTFDFNGWYTGPLMDLQTIINLNTDPATATDALAGGSNANQIAFARIMKVYYYSMLTDRWGMIPYSESLKGTGALRPKYDTQEAIYSDMINELKAAVAQMDGGVGLRGDFILNGNMARWAQFANSLRMKLALRIADRNPNLARAEFASAAAAGFITADIMYPYLAESQNQNPWFGRFLTRTDYAISDVLADYMIANGDYRVIRYADPAPNKSNGDGVTTMDEVVGMPYAALNPGNIENADVSFPGRAIRSQNSPLPIITMAEVHFMMAEGIERGFVTGNAAQHYRDANEASWKQWGVYNATDFDAYMATPAVAYASGSWKEKIGVQKWVALYPNGLEAWAEWRRLDFPRLTPHPDALNQSGRIPVRHSYPTTEVQLNKENYDAAVAAQGADNGDTKVWWDVN